MYLIVYRLYVFVSKSFNTGKCKLVLRSLSVQAYCAAQYLLSCVSSLLIDQCVVVLRTCVCSVSVVVSCLHLWVADGARRPRHRSPRRLAWNLTL